MECKFINNKVSQSVDVHHLTETSDNHELNKNSHQTSMYGQNKYVKLNQQFYIDNKQFNNNQKEHYAVQKDVSVSISQNQHYINRNKTKFYNVRETNNTDYNNHCSQSNSPSKMNSIGQQQQSQQTIISIKKEKSILDELCQFDSSDIVKLDEQKEYNSLQLFSVRDKNKLRCKQLIPKSHFNANPKTKYEQQQLSRSIPIFIKPQQDNKKVQLNSLSTNYRINQSLINEQPQRPVHKTQHALNSISYNSQKYLAQKINKYLNDRDKCNCELNLKRKDSCVLASKWFRVYYSEQDDLYLQKKYQELVDKTSQIRVQKSLQVDFYDNQFDYILQIEKDVARTFPKSQYYQQQEGKDELAQLLMCFSIYDPQVGYVQGINFIAASLLYHSQSHVAFWILVSLFEQFEMRDIYLPNLPGVSKHCQLIDYLILEHVPQIHKKLVANSVNVSLFCQPCIISFLGAFIPLDTISIFYDSLIEQGWPFFYKIMLAHLVLHEKQLLESDQLEMMMVLRLNDHNNSVNNSNSQNTKEYDWLQLFNTAQSIDIDTNFVESLLARFDNDTKQFKIYC